MSFEQSGCSVTREITRLTKAGICLRGKEAVGKVPKQQTCEYDPSRFASSMQCALQSPHFLLENVVSVPHTKKSYRRESRLVCALAAETSIKCQWGRLDSQSNCCDQQKQFSGTTWACMEPHRTALYSPSLWINLDCVFLGCGPYVPATRGSGNYN